VNNISRDMTQGGIPDSTLSGIQAGQAAKEVGAADTVKKENSDSLSIDLGSSVSTISDAAKEAYAKEKEVLKFSRLAQRTEAPYNTEKVAQLKQLVDSGQINQYLDNLSNETLANAMMGRGGQLVS
jgi:fatty acid-binding protein DegV